MSGSTSGITSAIGWLNQPQANSLISDPLKTMGSIVGIGNELMRNRVMQQELLNSQQTNQINNINMGIGVANRYAGRVMSVLANPNLSGQAGYDSIKQQMDEELQNNPTAMTRQIHDSIIPTIPKPFDKDGNPTSDETYRRWASQKGLSALTMAEQFQKMTPSTQYGAFGGVSYPITTPSDASRVINPNAQPSVNYGAGVRHLPAPGDLKDIDVPNGRGGYTKITVPVTALPGVPGGPPAGEGKGSGTSSSGVPTSGGYAVTKAPPGYDEALKTGTDFERGVIADASRINQQRANYSNMLEELDHIETGPGADKQLEAAAWLQRWGGNPMTAGITKEQIVSGQAFKKLSQQVANETAGMLSGSNQSQNNAALAQPNFDLVTQANQQIIHKIQGNLDAISAKIGAWNAWKAKYGAASSAQFQQWWNDNVDIRHFQAQHMADEERASIIGSIKSPREKDEFHRKARLFDHTLSGPNGWTKAIDNSQIPPMPPWVEGNHQ